MIITKNNRCSKRFQYYLKGGYYMIKKALRIILSLVMSFGLVLSSMNVTYASESDFATIKTRLKDYFLTLDTIDDGSKVETC